MHSFKNVSVHVLDEFVRRSTVADKKEEVVQFLLHYLHVYETTWEVKQFVKEVLHDETLLEKVVVVNDHEFYETVLTFSDRQVYHQEKLSLYKEQAETLFLHIKVEGKREEFKNWKEHYDVHRLHIVDTILDEFIALKKWEALIGSHEFQNTRKKWGTVLSLLFTTEE